MGMKLVWLVGSSREPLLREQPGVLLVDLHNSRQPVDPTVCCRLGLIVMVLISSFMAMDLCVTLFPVHFVVYCIPSLGRQLFGRFGWASRSLVHIPQSRPSSDEATSEHFRNAWTRRAIAHERPKLAWIGSYSDSLIHTYAYK